LSVNGLRHASQIEAKSAYFDLKNGLFDSFLAFSMAACAFDNASASFPIVSD
jgi:hypothetical protein